MMFIYSFASFTFYGYLTNSQCDQLPDGLIAQLVEQCTSSLGYAAVFRDQWFYGPWPEACKTFNIAVLEFYQVVLKCYHLGPFDT